MNIVKIAVLWKMWFNLAPQYLKVCVCVCACVGGGWGRGAGEERIEQHVSCKNMDRTISDVVMVVF